MEKEAKKEIEEIDEKNLQILLDRINNMLGELKQEIKEIEDIEDE